MATDRREFLRLALAAPAGLLPFGSPRAAGAVDYLATAADSAMHYFVAGLDRTGATVFRIALPGRGHGCARRPESTDCAVFARRPGDYVTVIDAATGAETVAIHATTGRHFYGHGVYSADGGALFTTENDFIRGRGVIGVYNAADRYRRVGEFDSAGIGPHQLELMPDRRTLAVANGGILTRPESGRAKLNLDDMHPSLAYIDSSNGAVLAGHSLADELSQLSIRHLCRNRENTVCLVMQYEGAQDHAVPLAALQRGSAPIQLVDLPGDVLARMNHYAGSCAVDASGAVFAVTAPRGDVAVFIAADGNYLASVTVQDCAGVAATGRPGEFLLSDGFGNLMRVNPLDPSGRVETVASDGAVHWDNHLTGA